MSMEQALPAREPGFYYDFLGVRTRMNYVPLPAWAEGHVFNIPEKDKPFLHSREEWTGLLDAIKDATGRFVAIELGAGWGPWLVAGHKAARQKGITDIHLIGVEACPEHVAMMRQHFADNGIPPTKILHAAIGPQDGTAWFPDIDPVQNWGQPAHYHPTANMHELSCVSLPTLLADYPAVDFLHSDIQGSEGEVFPAAMDTLNRKVRRAVIGTHSPSLHEQMRALFAAHHWRLEAETAWAEGTDGTQVWFNKTLAARRTPWRRWADRLLAAFGRR